MRCFHASIGRSKAAWWASLPAKYDKKVGRTVVNAEEKQGLYEKKHEKGNVDLKRIFDFESQDFDDQRKARARFDATNAKIGQMKTGSTERSGGEMEIGDNIHL
mmetsp:Transcript_21397/g.46463  ORF Transcript_21397/g.46463 Transcript_21397/m.46463 type:complete len:104 (+) Transcript_21397:547-858(+)